MWLDYRGVMRMTRKNHVFRSRLRKCNLILALFLVNGALGIPLFGAAPRSLKPEDFAQLRDVDEPNISPDGSLVVYVVKTADMDKDKLAGNLWLAWTRNLLGKVRQPGVRMGK